MSDRCRTPRNASQIGVTTLRFGRMYEDRAHDHVDIPWTDGVGGRMMMWVLKVLKAELHDLASELLLKRIVVRTLLPFSRNISTASYSR